ncbi:MAG: ABC transporter ATP-binding protein [Burkholderiaceae bacterium]|jgi:phospholipid/cholesterol/gamma-HCH transport system ATP-binding protein
MTDLAARVEGLDFGYGDRLILSGLSVDIPQGKVVSIMGGSGSGKTTLIRLLTGQKKPLRGKATVLGHDVAVLKQSDLYDLRRRMGVLFQFGALFTDMSVFDNVAFPLREHTRLTEPMIRDLVLMKLHAVGLRGAHRLMPAEISGGMGRRVALARAVALDPELIFYDEPFAGLDPISLGITANLIRHLNDALGATSVVVTHDIAESFAISDHVVVLANGSVVAQGTPSDIRTHSDPYVQQFIHGTPTGPVAFHYPAPTLAEEFD